jgi:hypothetical protein
VGQEPEFVTLVRREWNATHGDDTHAIVAHRQHPTGVPVPAGENRDSGWGAFDRAYTLDQDRDEKERGGDGERGGVAPDTRDEDGKTPPGTLVVEEGAKTPAAAGRRDFGGGQSAETREVVFPAPNARRKGGVDEEPAFEAKTDARSEEPQDVFGREEFAYVVLGESHDDSRQRRSPRRPRRIQLLTVPKGEPSVRAISSWVRS